MLLLWALLFAAAGVAAAGPQCESSCEPALCSSFILDIEAFSTPRSSHDLALAAVDRSLEAARSSAYLLSQAARRGRAGMALDDCVELLEGAAGDLELVRETLFVSAGKELNVAELEGEMTLMSSALAAAGSCLDGLEEVGLTRGELFRRVHEAAGMYGVALGLLEAIPSSTPVEIRRKDERLRTRVGKSASVGSGNSNGVTHESVTVAKDGSGNFSSVNDAVTFASENPWPPSTIFKIIVRSGIYVENVVIGKKMRGLMLVGAGMERTFITGNRSVGGGYTTYQTATFAVNGAGFMATGITFENTADPRKGQAVAVRNSADRSIFYRCGFSSFQDTLYAHSGRQLYLSSRIQGTVDFIFGRAAAVFQSCTILARVPLPGQSNTITAQGKACARARSGFSIHLSRILPHSDLVNMTGSVRTYLGRPWKSHSTAVFMQCYMQEFIRPEGWLEWGRKAPPASVYYGEFENYGRGAATGGRVRWEAHKNMRKEEAERFTVAELLQGDRWIPFNSRFLRFTLE